MTHTTDILFLLALCVQAGSLLLVWTSPEACRLLSVYLLSRADAIEAGRRRMEAAKKQYAELVGMIPANHANPNKEANNEPGNAGSFIEPVGIS